MGFVLSRWKFITSREENVDRCAMVADCGMSHQNFSIVVWATGASAVGLD